MDKENKLWLKFTLGPEVSWLIQQKKQY